MIKYCQLNLPCSQWQLLHKNAATSSILANFSSKQSIQCYGIFSNKTLGCDIMYMFLHGMFSKTTETNFFSLLNRECVRLIILRFTSSNPACGTIVFCDNLVEDILFKAIYPPLMIKELMQIHATVTCGGSNQCSPFFFKKIFTQKKQTLPWKMLLISLKISTLV